MERNRIKWYFNRGSITCIIKVFSYCGLSKLSGEEESVIINNKVQVWVYIIRQVNFWCVVAEGMACDNLSSIISVLHALILFLSFKHIIWIPDGQMCSQYTP